MLQVTYLQDMLINNTFGTGRSTMQVMWELHHISRQIMISEMMFLIHAQLWINLKKR